MFSERGGFRPAEENPTKATPEETKATPEETKATPEEIDTMRETSLQESKPTIADAIRETLDQINKESLISGDISPKDFVLQTINAIRTNPEYKIFATELNQAIRARSEKTGLTEDKIMEGMADIVGLWLQNQLTKMKKLDIKKTSIPQVLNDELPQQIAVQMEKMKEVTQSTEKKIEEATARRERWEALKEKKAA